MKNILVITRYARGFHNYRDGIDIELKKAWAPYVTVTDERDDPENITLEELCSFDGVALYNPAVWGLSGDSAFIVNMISYLATGGNVLILHANGMGQSNEGAAVFGSRFNMHPPFQEYRLFKKADAPEELTKGITEGYINDEMHMHYVDADLKKEILLYCKMPCPQDLCVRDEKRCLIDKKHQNRFGEASDWEIPVAWKYSYGKGYVIHVCPGHNAASYATETVREMMHNCAAYLTQREE